MNETPTHETNNELEFIRTIGTHSLHTRKIPRAEMLKRYLVGCDAMPRFLSEATIWYNAKLTGGPSGPSG